MTLHKLEEITGSDLRDHGTRERVDRGWRRVAGDIETAVPRPRTSMWWVPAAAAIIFGSGVVVGSKWARPEVAPLLTQERPAGNEPTSARRVPAPAPEERRHSEPPRNEPRRGARAPLVTEEQVLEDPQAVAPLHSLVEAPAQAAAPDWKQLYDSGDFKKAREALDDAGGFDAVVGGSTSAQLMSLADIARSTRRGDWAIRALRQVLESYPDTPEAPLAAITLSDILDKMGDEVGAADARATYRRLSPGGEFAEDVSAREVDDALTRGNLEEAARLVDQYAKDYPNGRRLDEFRKELEELRAASAGVEPPAPVSTSSAPRAPSAPASAKSAPQP